MKNMCWNRHITYTAIQIYGYFTLVGTERCCHGDIVISDVVLIKGATTKGAGGDPQKLDGLPPTFLMKSVITVTQQAAVHETGYTIRILFCNLYNNLDQGIGPPNFEKVVAPLVLMVWCWLVTAATGFVNVQPVNVVNRRSTDQRTDGATTSHAALRRELRETFLIDRDNGSCVCVCVCACVPVFGSETSASCG